MLFNSDTFLWFLLAFTLLYFVTRQNLSRRNWLILVASYCFYGWWDWRFLFLLLGSSLIDFYVGLALKKNAEAKIQKRLVTLSLGANLGALGVFKYFDFFSESLQTILITLGMEVSTPVLNVILPVGISFYTFQSLSYTIDIYRKKLDPTNNLTAFLAYVAFFPQLVAGPIERASNLLPQFLTARKVTQQSMEMGGWLIIWGLFKKVVLADNFGALSDMVYEDQGAEGAIVYFGTIAFGFQIYCDFSGYSDVARGLAYMMGFNLMVNFNLPYFATSPSDFWRRWHISLSTWFRDYLYIPLGGNRGGSSAMMRNLLITMLVAGLWHGAGWNFVLWGLWHGMMLCLFPLIPIPRRMQPLLGWFLTMMIVFYGWLLFRAQSMDQILALTSSLFAWSFPTWMGSYILNLAVFMSPLLAMQIWQHRTNTIIPMLPLNRVIKSALMAICVIMTAVFWNAEGTPFIYFQF